MTKLHEALKFATKAHKGQDRDGVRCLPYVTHVVDVLNKLRYVGKVTNEVQLIAGLLHDVLEETERTNEDIRLQFGEEVAFLIQELTRVEPDPAERVNYTEESWYELRNSLLLNEIREMGPLAQEVKLADRLSNVEGGLATKTGVKLERYIAQSRQILAIVPRERNPMLWDAIEALIK